ncbi:MAG: glycosyltransferase family 39 protein [Armatimonadota bacterium]|nr:glycosyltransferase family 39 protein [Armatimonadota bacterium]
MAISDCEEHGSSAERGRRSLLPTGFLVAFVAVVLRLLNLGGRPLHFSEALNVLIATLGITEIPRAALLNAGTPPFYHLVLSVWMFAFGRSDVAVRCLSVLVGLTGVAGTYVLARRLFSDRVAYIAVGIGAVSAYGVAFAQQATAGALLGVLALCSWTSLVLATDGSRRWWFWYVVATVLMLYTGDLAVVLVVAQWAYVLGVRRRRGDLRLYLLCQVVIVLAYLPWASLLVSQLVEVEYSLRAPRDALAMALRSVGLFAFGSPGFATPGPFAAAPPRPAYEIPILAPVLLMTALGALTAWPDVKARAAVFFWVIPVVVGLAVRAPAVDTLSLSALVPGFSILLAAGIGLLARRARREFRTGVAATLTLWIAVLNLPSLVGLASMPSWDGLDWRTAAGVVAKEATPSDVVVLVPGVNALPFARYFGGPQARVPFDPAGNDGSSSGERNLPLRRWAREGRGVWLIRSDYLPQGAVRQIEEILGRTHSRVRVQHYDRLVITWYAPRP